MQPQVPPSGAQRTSPRSASEGARGVLRGGAGATGSVQGEETGGTGTRAAIESEVGAGARISEPSRRAEAVRAAIDEVRGVGYFMDPIQEMEQVAVEPLPQLEEFLRQWRDLVAGEAAAERDSEWDTDQDRWQREAVRRLEGAAGLARVARATRRADDLRAWCQSLVEARDWKAALLAFEEAAGLVPEKEYARGEFLDGAALAAQELGRADLPARLERAWRGAPSMLRLRRWLGSANIKEATRKRAAEALAACPSEAHRQRAFLHVLCGDFEQAAKLLGAAAGLGWSNAEHPGHLLFPLFEVFLGRKGKAASPDAKVFGMRGVAVDELGLMTAEPDEPRAPEITRILQQAGIEGASDDRVRRAVLAAMRKAAERRLAGVTERKRRGHYAHAAELVATCVACDASPDAARWAASISTDYKRFPALRAELDRQMRAR